VKDDIENIDPSPVEEEKTDSTIDFPEGVAAPRPTLADDLEAEKKRLTEPKSTEAVGLVQKTIPSLDQATLGLRGLVLLAAPPGLGKSALALQLGVDAVRADTNVALVYVSVDQSRWEAYDRMLSRLARLEYRKLRLGRSSLSEEESKRLADAEQELTGIGPRIRVIDGSPQFIDLALLDANLREIKEGRTIVVIDSLDAWAPAGHAEETRLEALGSLRARVGEKGAVIAVVETRRALSQARKGEDDPLVTFLGSARRAAMADLILSLEVEGSAPGVGPQASSVGESARAVYVGVAKGRDGVVTDTIPLTHHHRESRFEPR
jgi:replicative DNA helicase